MAIKIAATTAKSYSFSTTGATLTVLFRTGRLSRFTSVAQLSGDFLRRLAVQASMQT